MCDTSSGNDSNELFRRVTECHSHLIPFDHCDLDGFTAGALRRSTESRLSDYNYIWMPSFTSRRHIVGDVWWTVLQRHVDHDHLNAVLRVSGSCHRPVSKDSHGRANEVVSDVERV